MKRTWLATTLMVFSLAQVFLCGPAARADDDATGAQLLPKDTLLFFSVPSIPDAKTEFNDSLAGALFRDPQLKPILDDIQKKIDELSEKLESEVGVTIPELLAVPEGELTFALVERPTRKLAPILMVDYGDNKETIEKLLKKLHDGLDGDIAEHSTEDIKDIKVHVYTFKENTDDNPFKNLVYFNDESYLVFSTEIDAIKEVLDRWDGDSTDTLANNDIYKYVLERCKEDSNEPSAVWFMSPIGLIQAGIGMAQSVAPQAAFAGAFLPVLGIDKLKGWGGAGYTSTGEFNTITKSFVYVDQPTTGVLNAFQFPATDLAPPKWVPADVSMYVGGNWNIAQAYQAIEGLVDSFNGRGFTAKLLDQAANSEGGPGIHPKKDVLDLLDGKYHLIQSVVAEGDDDEPNAKFLLALDVKDAAKMKKTLAKVSKSEGAQVETREFNGETIFEIEAGQNQVLSLCVSGGHFVVTNDTAALEGMLRSESPSSLTQTAGYRKIAKHFPAKVSMISYTNADAQLKSVYQMLKNADNVDFLDGIDLQKLPPFEVIQKYLRPSGSYTVPDKKGALTVGFQLSE